MPRTEASLLASIALNQLRQHWRDDVNRNAQKETNKTKQRKQAAGFVFAAPFPVRRVFSPICRSVLILPKHSNEMTQNGGYAGDDVTEEGEGVTDGARAQMETPIQDVASRNPGASRVLSQRQRIRGEKEARRSNEEPLFRS